MSQANQSTVERPVEQPSELLLAPIVSADQEQPVIRSGVVPFALVSHLLKGKPLRRPNRSRPVLPEKVEADVTAADVTAADTYAIQESAARAAGWDDPDLDIYDDQRDKQ